MAAPQDGIGTVEKDIAVEVLRQVENQISVTPDENAKVLRKIDWALLPILLTVYCLQSLDKTTLSYAAVFGLLDDTGLVGEQFSWLGSIVYLAQLVMQPAVAFLLVKLPIGKFLATMVFLWGSMLCCMAATHGFGGLLATRFFLGAFEAAVAPSFIAIVQMWYRRSEQTYRNALWYSMLGIVNMFGSLLTYALGHVHSALHSYQIIFLFCGLITVAVSVPVFTYMPNSPIEAKFLDHNEKLIAIERLRMNQMGVGSRVWKWRHVKEAILDFKTWLWFCMLTAVSIPSGGISTFGPLIIKAFGFDSFATILFNIPFGVVQIVATIGGALIAGRLGKKSPVIILLCVFPIVGITLLMVTERTESKKVTLLVSYYIISVYPGITPLIYSWSAQNTAGDTKQKVTTGILFVGASVGNVIGPLLYKPSEAPRYARGLSANLALFVAIVVVVLTSVIWIGVLNRRQAHMRERVGKQAHVLDVSMQASKSLRQQGKSLDRADHEGVGDKAFSDETDLRNEDFIYVY